MSVGWFDISAPDAPRTRRFYSDLFGWSVQVLDDTYSLVSAGGAPIGGVGQDGPGSPYTGLVVYFRVDDVADALDRAEKLGGTRIMAPQSTPTGRIAVFADPDGTKVGLISE